MWKVLASGLFRYRMGCFLFIAATCPDLLDGQSIFFYFFLAIKGVPLKNNSLDINHHYFYCPFRCPCSACEFCDYVSEWTCHVTNGRSRSTRSNYSSVVLE